MSEDDKAQLMGFVGVQADMSAWENHIEERRQIADKARQNAESEMRQATR